MISTVSQFKSFLQGISADTGIPTGIYCSNS